MKEGETVVLKKLGCAGWWYVRVLGKCQFLLLLLTHVLFCTGAGLDVMSLHKFINHSKYHEIFIGWKFENEFEFCRKIPIILKWQLYNVEMNVEFVN